MALSRIDLTISFRHARASKFPGFYLVSGILPVAKYLKPGKNLAIIANIRVWIDTFLSPKYPLFSKETHICIMKSSIILYPVHPILSQDAILKMLSLNPEAFLWFSCHLCNFISTWLCISHVYSWILTWKDVIQYHSCNIFWIMSYEPKKFGEKND